MENKMENYILRNVAGSEMKFKNFSGRITEYNTQGNRTFNVILPDDVAEDLKTKGWRIKVLESESGKYPAVNTIKVNVRFNMFPPKIYLVTGKRKELLTEETVGLLDGAEIIKADISISPYHSKKGKFVSDGLATAYLKTAYFTIEADPFEEEYAEFNSGVENIF